MSRANVELVQAAFRAFDSGDIEGVLRLCDEHIEITQAAELPGVSRDQHGHAGVREASLSGPSNGTRSRHGSPSCSESALAKSLSGAYSPANRRPWKPRGWNRGCRRLTVTRTCLRPAGADPRCPIRGRRCVDA